MSEMNSIPTYEDILDAQKVTFQDVLEHATGPVISIFSHILVVGLFGSVIMISHKEEQTDIEVQMEEVDIVELEEPPELPETETTETETDVEVEVDAPDVEAPVVEADDMDVDDITDDIETPTVMKANTSALVLPGVLGMRSGGNRMKMIKKYNTGRGGKRGGASAVEIEKATGEGLDWLSKNQNEDGSWGDIYKPGMTSLAMLALFAHGETPMSETYGEIILKGIKYLCDVSASGITNAIDGDGQSNKFGQIEYTNAMVAYALAEGYVLTKIPAMKVAMDKEIEKMIKNMAACGAYAVGYDNRRKMIVEHTKGEVAAIIAYKRAFGDSKEGKAKKAAAQKRREEKAKNKTEKSTAAGMHANTKRGGGGGGPSHPMRHFEYEHPETDKSLLTCFNSKWKKKDLVPAEYRSWDKKHSCSGPYIAWVEYGISVWHYQALKAAYIADCKVPGISEAIDKAIKFTKEHAYIGKGQFGYEVFNGNEGPVKEALLHPNKLRYKEYPMTNAGVLTLQILGEHDSKEAKEGLNFIEKFANGDYLTADWEEIGEVIDEFEERNEKNNKAYAEWNAKRAEYKASGKKFHTKAPSPNKQGKVEGLSFNNCIFSLYTWYYQTQVLFQSNKGKNEGTWKIWNNNMTRTLVKEQEKDGHWTSPTFKYSKYAVAGETSKTLYRANAGKSYGIFARKGQEPSNRPDDFSYTAKEASMDLKVYSTAMCVLQLTVYYRYLPTYKLSSDKAIEGGGMKDINDDLGLSID